MNPHKLKHKSKKLSWLLRHGANESRLEMDEAGWVEIADVLQQMRMTTDDLYLVVRENNKSRLEVQGDRIRACQGHSTEGTPVTCDALERSWVQYKGDAPVWHGTSLEALGSIKSTGISAQRRTHVHLSEGLHSRTGKRAGVAVMLEVCPVKMRAAGLGIFRSPNGVLLARRVPPACITGAVPMTRKAQERRGTIARAFALKGKDAATGSSQ